MGFGESDTEKLDEVAELLSRVPGGRIELLVFGTTDPKKPSVRKLAAGVANYLIKERDVDRRAIRFKYAGTRETPEVVVSLYCESRLLFETSILFLPELNLTPPSVRPGPANEMEDGSGAGTPVIKPVIDEEGKLLIGGPVMSGGQIIRIIELGRRFFTEIWDGAGWQRGGNFEMFDRGRPLSEAECKLCRVSTRRKRSKLTDSPSGNTSGDCYCALSELEVLTGLVKDQTPDQALVNECCWKKICAVRGKRVGFIDKEAWRRVCKRRGSLKYG